MNVLVNAVAARLGGGARHLAPFMTRLADALPDSRFEVLVTDDFTERTEHPRVTWTSVRVPQGITPARLRWDQITVARRARSFDALISPLNFGPIFVRVPHVLFQRNALYFDRDHLRNLPRAARARFAGYRWLAVLQCITAEVVVVPSQAMGEMLRRYLPRRKRLVVAPHGLDTDDIRAHQNDAVVPRAQAWAEADVRLLHVGHASPHKNLAFLPGVVAGVARGREGSVRLAVTTEPDRIDPSVNALIAEAERCGVLHLIDFVGALNQHEVFALYGRADVLLLPSTTESFGFPVLEAFAVGLPVVAADLPAFREVGGALIRVFDHGDTDEAVRLVTESLGVDSDTADLRRSRADQFDLAHQANIVAGEISRLAGQVST